MIHTSAVVAPPEPTFALFGFALPQDLGHFRPAIERSRSMLDLPDDWDGDGSPGYAEATWQRAVQVVVESSSRYWRTSGQAPPAPSITPGPDVSIDVEWRPAGRKLVLNVPEEPAGVVTFYGKDQGSEQGFIRGEFHVSRTGEWLVGWLAG